MTDSWQVTERWVELRDFPGYAVSDHGRVINTRTDIVKRPSRNQQGIAMVNFSINTQQHVRSVALLVANTFMSDANVPAHFDTPINLNGDRYDCRVANLAWRPRWFAVRYHQQFNPSERATRFGFRSPIEIVETGERFPNSWEAAIKYGLIDFDILLAVQNRTYVFPINQRIRVLDE